MTSDGDVTITWWGHACVEVRTSTGATILIDPWFGNPLSPRSADEVERCDLLLVTHGHSDHVGDALSIAQRTSPVWPAMHEISLWAGPQLPGGAEAVTGMNKGGTFESNGIKVTMVHADHSSGDWDEGAETTRYLGEPAGFVVELENGFRFYHAGDTNVFGDMRLIGELYRPDLAMLPIGGHYTMGPREAALACELLGVQRVLPIHWGTFSLLAGNPDQLREELRTRGVETEVVAVDPGTPFS